MDPMMRYLDANVALKETLECFVAEENQKFRDEYAEKLLEKARNNERDLEVIIKEAERSYKDELIQFADRVGPTDEDIFGQSFHRLVHSSSLEEILLKERSYTRVISDMIQHVDQEVETLASSQQEEMESKIDQLDITTTSEI